MTVRSAVIIRLSTLGHVASSPADTATRGEPTQPEHGEEAS